MFSDITKRESYLLKVLLADCQGQDVRGIHGTHCFLQVLHCCVCGSSTYTQQSHYTLTLADLSSPDYDPFLPLANVKNSEPVQYHSSADLGNLLTVEEGEILQNINSHGQEKERL